MGRQPFAGMDGVKRTMGRIFTLGDDGIEELLRAAGVGRIACCDRSGARPYLVPLPYGYDGESIYSSSGPGRKLDLLRAQPAVACGVVEVQAEDRWHSVVADGEFADITDPCERRRA